MKSQHRGPLVRRTSWILGLAQLVIVVIAVSYFWVQVAEGEYYRELADNNRLRKTSLEAPRGLILDRNGQTLAENVPSYSLLFDPTLSRDRERSLTFAAGILGVDADELEQRFRERPGVFQQVRLAAGLDLAQVARFAVEQLEHPEFETAAEHLRLYRYAHHTAHVLGYLGRISPNDLASGRFSDYQRNDLRGKEGVEELYESFLRGRRGEQLVVVDSRGRRLEERALMSMRAGRDLRLTLDIRLQQEAAQLLEGQQGTIVALDPRNGDVLALVSMPSFDPNAFVRGLSREEWRALREDPDKRLQNRALLHAPPGSVFKVAVALAGLKSGLVTPATRTFCKGSVQIYNHRFRCWKASGHGWEDIHGAFRDSCDVYFYEIGKRVGIEAIAEAARQLGLGAPTGLGLGGEVPGLVPGNAWSERVRKAPWYPGETISVAIGQGPILTTPLQVASMFAAVARGHRVRPRLTFEEVVREEALPFRPEHLEAVRRGLRAVIDGGTGRSAAVPGLAVAGKTGTAQVVRQETWTSNEELPPELRDHAWFASYAPADDPRLVVVVFIEHGGAGSKAAAPLARRMYERFLDLDPA